MEVMGTHFESQFLRFPLRYLGFEHCYRLMEPGPGQFGNSCDKVEFAERVN